MAENATKLVTALDVDSIAEALCVVDTIGSEVEWYKVGKQLFTREGPALLKALKERNKKIFLDLKYHDIPNTVGAAVRSAAAIGADLINVHALGGLTMLKSAREAADECGVNVIAVTVLTSMDKQELDGLGFDVEAAELVLRLATLTKKAGLPGVVCSAHEIKIIQEACGKDFLTVVPGIRPAGSQTGDQKRVMTPAEAAKAGASFIVVGRPILKAENPAEAARNIQEELRQNN